MESNQSDCLVEQSLNFIQSVQNVSAASVSFCYSACLSGIPKITYLLPLSVFSKYCFEQKLTPCKLRGNTNNNAKAWGVFGADNVCYPRGGSAHTYGQICQDTTHTSYPRTCTHVWKWKLTDRTVTAHHSNAVMHKIYRCPAG
jgi:hypothetical protein